MGNTISVTPIYSFPLRQYENLGLKTGTPDAMEPEEKYFAIISVAFYPSTPNPTPPFLHYLECVKCIQQNSISSLEFSLYFCLNNSISFYLFSHLSFS